MTLTMTDPTTVFTEHEVEAGGFRIRYYAAGDGDPVIVLHGAGGVHLTPALAMLAEGFRVVPVELPGWGAERNERSQSLDDLAETVAAVAAAIGHERYHLLGTSLGGAVALHLALLHPEQITSMVLEGPAQFRVGSRPPVNLSPEETVRAFRVHPDRDPVWEPPNPEDQQRYWPVVERVLVSTPDYDEDVARRMTECPVRTLVLFGTRDGVIPPDNGRTYRRLLPNSSLEYVYDAAHAIQADRAEAFVDVVSDFLRRGMLYLIPDQDTIINP
jgi:pimeloyl-ACP methyl ester carboxylesterase